METYILYTHFWGIEKLIQLIEKTFPKSNPKVTEKEGYKIFVVQKKKGLLGKTEALRINYRERESPSFNLRTGNCPVTEQLRGLYGYVSSLPIKDTKLRSLFLAKIDTLNAEIIFQPDPKLSEDMHQLLKTIAQKLNALVFLQPGQTLSKSETQQFLDEDLGLITDINGNTGPGEIKVIMDTRFFDDQTPPTEAQLQRKQRTEKLLEEHQIKINKYLPVTPDAADTRLRDQQTILERAYCLALVAARGEGVPSERLLQEQERLSILQFTPGEQTLFVKEELTDQDKAIMTWRYESLNVLFWSLGLVDNLVYPSAICDVSDLISNVIKYSRAELEAKIRLRDTDTILEHLDQTYRMHWACVDSRLNKRQPDGGLNPSIIYERHYALNWLTQFMDSDWDSVTTPT